MSFPAPTFQELEETVRTLIGHLKAIPDYANTRFAVIGGMALWRYIPNGRGTKDADAIVTIPGAPGAVKTRLLSLPNTPFEQASQFFYYKHPGGKKIQIDITPDWQSPYIPAAAVPLSTIEPHQIPYASMIDLLALKVNSCGLRATEDKRVQDALDAMNLVNVLSANGRVSLNGTQRQAIQQGLDAVFGRTGTNFAWWNARLQLQ